MALPDARSHAPEGGLTMATDNVDLLRRAAARMRELAERATPGPWVDPRDPEPHIGEFGWHVAGCPAGETEDSPQGRADAQYIAEWYPPVALAVADWLEHEASAEEYSDPPLVPSVVPGSLKDALAVARAFLREDQP